AQRDACDRAGMRDYGCFVPTRSLCRTARLGIEAFSQDRVESACPLVARQIGGFFLFHLLNFTVLVANIGSGMGAQLGAARLLYGMGRSDGIPKKFFGALDPKNRIPRNNVIFVGAIALVGAFLISYEKGTELLNFGALLAFMGV